MSGDWWRSEQLEEHYTAWQCAVSHVEYLEKQNARLREALEEIAKSSSGCECCTEGALNREELGDVARRMLKEGYNG